MAQIGVVGQQGRSERGWGDGVNMNKHTKNCFEDSEQKPGSGGACL